MQKKAYPDLYYLDPELRPIIKKVMKSQKFAPTERVTEGDKHKTIVDLKFRSKAVSNERVPQKSEKTIQPKVSASVKEEPNQNSKHKFSFWSKAAAFSRVHYLFMLPYVRYGNLHSTPRHPTPSRLE
jgi:hypothetical protein